jgi:ABC-type Fe3+-hydroxamate transport system substrate-binding protein
MNTKILAIATVVILVVAGIGIVWFLNDGKDIYRSDDNTGRLMIYGNADNNDYIDDDDIKTLESIIAGETTKTALSDANQDGKIDQNDIDLVKRLINREKGVTLYYQYIFDGAKLTKSIKYPVSDICVIGTNVMITVKAIGAVDKVVARNGGDASSVDPVLYSDIIGLPAVSDSVRVANIEDVSKYPIKAIVTQDSTSYVENENSYIAAGIDVIRISASDGLDSLAGILTLGYLLEKESGANDYVKFCDDILSKLESKVGKGALKDSERVTALSVTMTNYVGGTISDYYAATELAGAKNLADWNTTTKRFQEGDEWLLSPQYQSDFIVHARTIGYGSIDEKKTWDTYSIYFKELDAYKDGGYLILNGSMPVSLRLAYMASIFYPEIFGEDWGSNLHQEYIDRFIGNLHDKGYDVNKDGSFIITKDMIDG